MKFLRIIIASIIAITIKRTKTVIHVLLKTGMPVEDKMERAQFDANEFPNVLVEVWDNEETKCFSWHVCPFFLDMKGGAE